MIIFDGGPQQPETLEEVVVQAVGAGSACWEHLDRAGVFQSERAKAIAEEVIDWIDRHYVQIARSP